jgi:DNA-binding MarR family transcriptional regulator
VTSGAVTGVVDRLVDQGVALRQSDAADRRRVVISARLEGFEGRENVYAGIGAAFRDLYDGYTADELRFLARHLERAVAITIAETAALA